MTLAAAQFGMFRSAEAQSGKAVPADVPPIEPGTNTSFGSLKQIGEPKYDDLEKRLAEAPVITVPTITLEGDANGAPHPDASSYAKKFSGKYSHRIIKGGVGHNLPQEAPQAFAQAVVDVDCYLSTLGHYVCPELREAAK
jgi:pimeloyl-ACP methyl ester carboxylesterase